MQENPLITLLMPVYNSPDLFRSLESVRCQTYRPLRFVMIDDCSKTFEEERIRSFFSEMGEDFDFILFHNEKNIGTVRSMNRGLSVAEGKYLFNLASDDAFYDEEVLADWVAAFEQTECDVLTARRAICDDHLQEILEILPTEDAISKIKHSTPRHLFEYLAKENQISGACTSWRLETLRRLNLFDESYFLLEDYPSYLKLLRSGGRIAFFDRIVVRYRSGGISAQSNCVSPAYESDFVEIYRREIIPHVRRPLLARRRLLRWRNSVRFDRFIFRELERSGGVGHKAMLLRFWYYLYHPMRLIRESRTWTKR